MRDKSSLIYFTIFRASPLRKCACSQNPPMEQPARQNGLILRRRAACATVEVCAAMMLLRFR
jgi:hypothetical protein